MRILGVALITLFAAVAVDAGQVIDTNPNKPIEAKPSNNEKVISKLEQDAEKLGTNVPVTTPKASERNASRKHRFGIFAAVGDGDGSVESVAFGVDYHPEAAWFEGANWHLVSYIELLAGYWESDDTQGHTGVTSLHEAGLSCYLRYIRSGQESTIIRPYLDTGLGLHYITESEIEGKELGRQWLAGSNLGGGIVFGESERIDIGIRIRHLSNGGTEEINWGINHLMLRAAIRF